MKKALVVTFFLIAVVLGSVVLVSAGAVPGLFVNVPFAFHAGNQLVPAGEYVFEMLALGGHSATGSTLAIHTRDGSVFLYLNAIRGDARSSNPAYTVTFTRYGGAYFLSVVQNGGITSGLPKTSAEKELALAYSNKSGGSKEVVVVSSTHE